MDAAGREMQVRTFVEEVWNGRNYQAVSDLYGENYASPFGIGPAARAEPIRRYHQAFPDLHIDIEELIAAGDTVVLRAVFRGTDTGGYAGRAATGHIARQLHDAAVPRRDIASPENLECACERSGTTAGVTLRNSLRPG